MEAMATLQKIIESEREAARLLAQAEAKRASQEERIRAGKDALMLRLRDEAEAQARSAEAEARARADGEITSMQAETDARLAALRESYAVKRDAYAEKLFRLTIGEDDES